ncbi:hypothetical protein VAR608DRAFT_2489 [Variovorax sp. HW608]|nr:hypothetical protein [Variovorax sp. HW608]SCK29602.1 hypothetical protein VAR608DRAFT_2489 [Variovorax sp. HW608]
MINFNVMRLNASWPVLDTENERKQFVWQMQKNITPNAYGRNE